MLLFISNKMANLRNATTTEKATKTGLSEELLIFLMTTTTNDKGNSFAYINGYKAKGSNEIANFKLNLNFRYENARIKDVIDMKNINLNTYFETFKTKLISDINYKIKELINNDCEIKHINHFKALLNNNNITKELMLKAYENSYNSLIKVGSKNLDGGTKKSTKSIDAQNEIYDHINGTVKMHIEKQQLYIYARKESKKVIIKGDVKTGHTKLLTMAQNSFKHAFKSTRYRNFIIDRADIISAFKHKFEGAELSVDI